MKHEKTGIVADVLRQCLAEIESDIAIAPSLLARCALKKLDPTDSTLAVITWIATLQLREMARALLRDTFSDDAVESKQHDMFPGCQAMYPTMRDGESTYVPLKQITPAELQDNIDRLAREVKTKNKHIRALRAYQREMLRGLLKAHK